jgi:hypothetical protein
MAEEHNGKPENKNQESPETNPTESPADSLRGEIEKLTGRRPKGAENPKSPREFIQERMRELDKKQSD